MWWWVLSMLQAILMVASSVDRTLQSLHVLTSIGVIHEIATLGWLDCILWYSISDEGWREGVLVQPRNRSSLIIIILLIVAVHYIRPCLFWSTTTYLQCMLSNPQRKVSGTNQKRWLSWSHRHNSLRRTLSTTMRRWLTWHITRYHNVCINM